ncbi:MAG: hypothetical protein ABS82_15275 [Rhodanobacter sp. SCN 67-45]|nr:MAG: hypothetical protein ABS82_15275 [Rhodanobacter sp. SCN 67-45]
MFLNLVHKDRWCIPIEVDDRLEDALNVQWERARGETFDLAFFVRLSGCLEKCFAQCLDPDLRLPTDGQVRYAMAIARELGVSLPAEAFRLCGSTHEFIDCFESAFRSSRARLSRAKGPAGR